MEYITIDKYLRGGNEVLKVDRRASFADWEDDTTDSFIDRFHMYVGEDEAIVASSTTDNALDDGVVEKSDDASDTNENMSSENNVHELDIVGDDEEHIDDVVGNDLDEDEDTRNTRNTMDIGSDKNDKYNGRIRDAKDEKEDDNSSIHALINKYNNLSL